LKTSFFTPLFPGKSSRFLTALLGLGGVAFGAAPAVGPAMPKTHTLFMGTDIAVEQNKKIYPITNVTGTAFIVSAEGAPLAIPMRGEPHNLKIAQTLKLTAVSASLTGLKSERTYTPGADPRMRRQREALQVSAVISDNAALAIDKYSYAQSGFGSLVGPGSGPGAGISQAEHQANIERVSTQALNDFGNASAMLNSNLTSGGFYSDRADDDLAQELFDAVEVSFAVASETPLHDPYVIIITRFHEKNAKPGEVRNAIFAKAMNPIGPKLQKIELLHGGFPRGFVIEDLQVHLYNLGEEIATDVVSKRVPLTRDEAFTYVKIQYLSSHKDATVAATPVLGRLSAETRAGLTSQQLSSPYFVRVSKDGLPVAAYADKACTQPVDAVLDPLIANVRFTPALEKGKPVESVARLLFTHLTL